MDKISTHPDPNKTQPENSPKPRALNIQMIFAACDNAAFREPQIVDTDADNASTKPAIKP